MLRQKRDLADVIRRMSCQAIEDRDDEQWFTADHHGPLEIFRRERLDRCTVLPKFITPAAVVVLAQEGLKLGRGCRRYRERQFAPPGKASDGAGGDSPTSKAPASAYVSQVGWEALPPRLAD